MMEVDEEGTLTHPVGAPHHHRRADRPAQRPHLRHRRRQRAGRIRQRLLRRPVRDRHPGRARHRQQAARRSAAAALSHRHQCRRRHVEGRRHLRRRRQHRGTPRRAGRARRHLHFTRCARPYPPQAAAQVRGSRRAGGQEHRPAGALLSPLPRRRQARAAAAARADLAAVGTAQGAEGRRPDGRAGVLGIDQGQPEAERLRSLSSGISRGQLRHAGPCPARRIHRSGRHRARRRPTPTSSASFWESVRDSENPEFLQAYLDKYPAGEFCALAEIRLKELGETPAMAK